MKYFILPFLFFLLGCSLEYYEQDISSVPYFDTWEEYHGWFRKNIEYRDTGSGMYSPKHVLTNGCGDCDSLSLCLGYIIQERLGFEVTMTEITDDNYFPRHAFIKIEGHYIELLRHHNPTAVGYRIVDE